MILPKQNRQESTRNTKDDNARHEPKTITLASQHS